jgi:hypothetical protein
VPAVAEPLAEQHQFTGSSQLVGNDDLAMAPLMFCPYDVIASTDPAPAIAFDALCSIYASSRQFAPVSRQD